jgi:transcriptional regulator with XRE-family HTH domain
MTGPSTAYPTFHELVPTVDCALAPATSRLTEQQAIGRSVRAWRQHVSRSSLGLPGAGALTQADVARRCGVTVGWYRALENGSTDANFSDEFLLAVADTLRLDESQVLALFLGAKGRRPPETAYPAVIEVPLELTMLLTAQEPNPAYLTDHAYNVVSANKTFHQWFPFADEPRPNMLRWLLLDPRSRTCAVDWERGIVSVLLAILRLACHRNPSRQLEELLTEIIRTDATCRRIWTQEHDVRETLDGHRFRARQPDGGLVDVVSHVLLPGRRPDLRFVALSVVGVAGAEPRRAQRQLVGTVGC